MEHEPQLAWRNPVLHGIRSRNTHAVVCVVATAFVSWGLLSPDPFAVVRLSGFGWLRQVNDLAMHLGAFCTLTIAIVTLSLRILGFLPLTIVAGLVCYAVATEILQTFVPGRTCDPADALANTTGIILGIIAAHRMLQICQRRLN